LGVFDYYAAQVCDSYENNGFSDWFLPSRYELAKLYENKDYVGNLEDRWYWSSSKREYEVSVYVLRFIDGKEFLAELYFGEYALPIRTF